MQVGERALAVSCISMGNPHCVVFVDKSNDGDVHTLGPLLELHPVFPERTNVEFAVPRSRRDVDVRVWERVYTVGCPLGNDPIPTRGEISSVKNQLNGTNYWMINAPTYFGNSGGGVYLAESRELVGVFSKIYTHGRGNPIVVPHMGLCTPMDSIYAWLERDGMEFVLEERALAAPELEIAAKPAGN